MKLSQATRLVENSDRDERRSLSKKLIESGRNRTLEMHKDYYDGKHWDIGVDQKTNKTRSGKTIWGKVLDSTAVTGAYGDRTRAGSSTKDISFHEGQLQIRNYIKRFTQIYQDSILGSSNEDVVLTHEDEAITEALGSSFVDYKSILKLQVAKLVTATVAIQKISYHPSTGYVISAEDAAKIVPIYVGNKHVGTIASYMITKEEAKAMFGVAAEGDDAVFMDMYYPDEEGNYINVKFVDGVMIEEPMRMPDTLNFDPYCIVSNLDHPYRKFDEYNLEDSEIFSWINDNDALNANETIEFMSNQYYALPKVSVDYEMLDKMGVDINSASFQQAMSNFQYFAGSIDSLPIEVHDGKTIPDSFYKGKETIKTSLFEEAGIPQFLLNAESISNIAEGTVKLGMQIFTRKIEQKRERLMELTRMTAYKIAKAQGLIPEDAKMHDFDISISFPDLVQLTKSEQLEQMYMAADRAILPEKYITREVLELLGKGEDLIEVEAEKQDDLDALRAKIEAGRRTAQSEAQARAQIERQERDRRDIEETQAQINALNNDAE